MTAPIGDVAGPVDRVLVVGGGISGLTVANALHHEGVACTVLEARQRVGGRLHTVDLGGSVVDMGASWIHHPVGNPLARFAEEAGLALRDGDPVPELTGFDCAERRRVPQPELEAMLHLAYQGFPDAAPGLRRSLGSDAGVKEAIDAFTQRCGLDERAARLSRQLLLAVVEAAAADRAERQSLTWMGDEAAYEGPYFGPVPAGGYATVAAAMAAGLDVRTGFEASGIDVSGRGVTVRGVDGGAEAGSHAVVTVPLGVLKRGALRFSPALSPDRVAAVDRLGFGAYEKVAMRFDRAFWHDDGLTHLLLFPPDPGEPAVRVLSQDAFGGGPVLLFFVPASLTHHVLSSEDGATKWALGLLAAARGRECPGPSEVVVSRWSADPYCGGAYTHIPPGAAPDDVDALGAPVHGRLLFAGEHTQSARLGYADGAMSSGLREASRLLGGAAVRVARIT